MECSICGIGLNALNMSDIENDKCQDCVRDILDKIETNDESAETRYLSDGVLESIIRQNNDRTGRTELDLRNNTRGRQRMNRYGMSRRKGRPYNNW